MPTYAFGNERIVFLLMHGIACDVFDEKGGSPVCMKLLTTQRTTAALQQIQTQSFLGFLAMVSRMRLAADPSVGVADVVRALQEALEEEGSRDLLRLLHHKYQFTWKSAPDAEWLGGDFVSKLYKKLFQIHVNGVMQGKKVKTALLKVQTEKGRLNFTKLHDSDWADKVDEVLRIGAAMYRDMKKDSLKYSRCTKKASPQEKQHIDDVLSFLQLGQEEELPEVVPEVAAKSYKGLEEKLPEVGLVFTKVLQKKSSEPESPQLARVTEKAANTSLDVVPASSSAVPASSSATPKGERPVLKRQMAQLQLEEDEEKELLVWMSEKVPETKKKKRSKKNTGGKQVVQGKKDNVKAKVKAKVKKPFKQQSFGQHKCSLKHRKTSTAYHSAQKLALRQGASKEEAKEAGKKAMQKMAQKIDSGEVKPPPGQK